MKLFDSHCHLDDKAFDEDRESVIKALPQKGISKILWAGVDIKTSLTAAKYAAENPYIYFACGFQPLEVGSFKDGDIQVLEELAKDPKCAAIGEIGLDYHYQPETRQLQLDVFAQQLDLAVKVGKPVVIHSREATEDMLEVLEKYAGRLSGVMHCFSGSAETAKVLLDLGLYLSFTGVITFKNAKKAVSVVEYAPKDRILAETDSPYMTPEPFRGTRNTPDRVGLVVQKMAQIWGIPYEEAAEITYNNACRLFKIF